MTRATSAQLLTDATADALGTCELPARALRGGQLVNRSFQTTTALGDVYNFMLSFRYSFN